MTITLQLSDAETEALRVRANEQGLSLQEAIQQAISEYVTNRRARLQAAINQVVAEDGELLDRLSR